MKRLTAIIAALALLGLVGVSMAQTSDNHSVQVSASSVARIDVSNAAVLFILNQTTPGDDYAIPAPDATSTLSWSHNQTTNQEITVVAQKNIANPTNNITLRVTYGGAGGATVTIVNAGSDGNGVVKDDFGRGKEKDQSLTYQVMSANMADTPTGNYSWTVTYTIQNNS